MPTQLHTRFKQQLCDHANGSSLWARVGASSRSIASATSSAERALQAALMQSREAIEPELACSTYVITCVY